MGSDLAAAIAARARGVAAPRASSYASANRIYRVHITRPVSEPTFDRATEELTVPAPLEVYTGPGRFTPVSPAGTDTEAGDENTYLASAELSIDIVTTLDPRVDDVVEVLTTAVSTVANLEGRVFRVTGVSVGGHFNIGWALSVTGVAPSRQNT